MEERKGESSPEAGDSILMPDTQEVQNKIESMRLNFDLLERKLGQEQ